MRPIVSFSALILVLVFLSESTQSKTRESATQAAVVTQETSVVVAETLASVTRARPVERISARQGCPVLAYTPLDGLCPDTPKDVYLHAREAVDAVRNRYWYDRYALVPVYIAEVAIEEANQGRYPLDVYDMVDHLASFAWWESSYTPRGGGIGEQGLTQVTPCDSTGSIRRGIRCNEGGFNRRTLMIRPTREWLREDPRNGLRWTAGYLQWRGHDYGALRRYNGSGPNARAYSRRHIGTLERIEQWRSDPFTHRPPLLRDVRSEDSPWRQQRPNEPRGRYW
jgi:hypothetical protein|tara:strand:- start:5269 stop:6114 length:846 start_codon:yes stop_codon:yes gene_type:complete